MANERDESGFLRGFVLTKTCVGGWKTLFLTLELSVFVPVRFLVPVHCASPFEVNSMSQSLRNYTFIVLIAGLFCSAGCGPTSKPTGPEKGSVQAYLDENPDVAARIDEGVEEEEEDDGTGE